MATIESEDGEEVSISCVQLGEGVRHQLPGGPIAEVLIGDVPGRQIGLVQLIVPAGDPDLREQPPVAVS